MVSRFAQSPFQDLQTKGPAIQNLTRKEMRETAPILLGGSQAQHRARRAKEMEMRHTAALAEDKARTEEARRPELLRQYQIAIGRTCLQCGATPGQLCNWGTRGKQQDPSKVFHAKRLPHTRLLVASPDFDAAFEDLQKRIRTGQNHA